ncbi:Na+/H+ antiporter subunit E [Plantactinospora siamensis]|uniref:Na+/H+ antiporter subunit E n=1 Tax=Plantactinospora siamensis TaxID=555372 RepID=A0ABV6NSL7_9ACTN
MTPDVAARATTGRRGRWRERLIALVGLVVIWSLFWGEFSWANTIGGALVGAVVLVLYPLPPLRFGGRVRPLAVLSFALWFVADLVTASLRLSLLALRRGGPPRSAVLAVRLRVPTDLNITLTAEALSLVPGSLIVDIDRGSGTLFVHVLDVRGPADLAKQRRHITEVEGRLVRALGSRAERAAVRAAGREGTP